MNTIPQALPGFEGHAVDAPKKEPLPPFKYLEVEVTREQYSIVYLKVPRDFDINKIKRGSGRTSILSEACRDTLESGDWDDYNSNDEIGWNSIKEVPEKTATAYQIYDVDNYNHGDGNNRHFK